MLRTSQPSITDFPVDLILLISEHLDNGDLSQCILVSAAWNATFRPLLYQTVAPRNYRTFCTFYKAIEQSTKISKRKAASGIPRMADLGCSVRTLHMRDGYLTIKRIQQLSAMCPNVTSVHFDWEEKEKALNTSASARLFESPLPFFKHFHPSSLRSLNFRLLNYARYPDGLARNIMIPILQYLPQLESLTLNENTRCVTIAFLERLHDKCPRLKQLLIDGIHLHRDDDTIPLSAIKNVKPANTMEKLSIEDFSAWAEKNVFERPWWIYITHKYPALKYLNITSSWFKRPPIRAEHRATQSSPTAAFRDFFPQLDELVLGVFAYQFSTAWPQLIKGIRKISLHDHCSPFFSEWISNEATSTIIQLTMWRFPVDLQDLKHCPQLQELELDSRTTAAKSTMMLDDTYSIKIDVILSCCPALKRLTVNRGQIFCCYGNAEAKKAKSPLRSLVLKSCVIASNTTLDHVGQWCPKLIHLDLYDCMWIIPDEDPIIRINLPQHWLSYFRMFNARVFNQLAIRRYGRAYKDERIALCKLFMVKTPEQDGIESPLFNAGREHAFFVKPYLKRLNNSAIARWLNASLDDDNDVSEDSATIRDNAMKAIASLESSMPNSLRDSLDRSDELSSDHKECSCTVLICGSIDRLYYGNYGEFRLFIDTKPLSSVK